MAEPDDQAGINRRRANRRMVDRRNPDRALGRYDCIRAPTDRRKGDRREGKGKVGHGGTETREGAEGSVPATGSVNPVAVSLPLASQWAELKASVKVICPVCTEVLRAILLPRHIRTAHRVDPYAALAPGTHANRLAEEKKVKRYVVVSAQGLFWRRPTGWPWTEVWLEAHRFTTKLRAEETAQRLGLTPDHVLQDVDFDAVPDGGVLGLGSTNDEAGTRARERFNLRFKR